MSANSSAPSPDDGNIDARHWQRLLQRSKERGDCEGVVNAMRSGSKWPQVVISGAKCIRAMSATGTAQTDIDFGRHGAIPVLVHGLEAHGETNASVAEAGCGALRNLAHNNNDNKTTMGESGGIPLILRMLEAHGETNASVAEAGCSTLRNLAHNNDDNKTTIGESGGISLIIRALEAHGETNVSVAEAGCEVSPTTTTTKRPSESPVAFH